MKHKIFCIGLNKTGTLSLHEAFQILEINSVHDSYKCGALMEAAIQGNYKLLHYLNEYEAFSDYPFFRYFRELDMEYPKSKFILNTRDPNSWLRSRINHDTRWNQQNSIKPARIVNEEVLLRFFTSVEREIKDYFEGRNRDFIEFDIENGDGWDKLCGFLEFQIPNQPFPHNNKS